MCGPLALTVTHSHLVNEGTNHTLIYLTTSHLVTGQTYNKLINLHNLTFSN